MQTVAAYIIPAILTLLGIAQYDFSHHKKGKNFLWLTLYLYLIVVMGFRFEVGGDTLTYMSWFEWARDLQHWTPTDIYEPGFTIIGAIVKSCNGEFYHLQLIHAVILNTCIFIFISQNTRYRFSALLMAFLTYYIYFSTEVMRESIAVFIFTFNYKSFLERRWKTYYIGVVVCMFFHLSSSFLLLLPLLRNLKFNNRFLMVIVVACCIFYVMNPIISLLDSFVPIIADKAKSYGRHTYVGYFWVGMRVIQFSVIPYFVLYLNKKHISVH